MSTMGQGHAPWESSMQVERQFVEVRTRQVVIDLPESFVNRRVELILR